MVHTRELPRVVHTGVHPGEQNATLRVLPPWYRPCILSMVGRFLANVPFHHKTAPSSVNSDNRTLLTGTEQSRTEN